MKNWIFQIINVSAVKKACSLRICDGSRYGVVTDRVGVVLNLSLQLAFLRLQLILHLL